METCRSGAVVAVFRHRLGLTESALADALGVSARTVRDWECGRAEAPTGVVAQLVDLDRQHQGLVEHMVGVLAAGEPLVLPKSSPVRGWYVAAAAAAMRDVDGAQPAVLWDGSEWPGPGRRHSGGSPD